MFQQQSLAAAEHYATFTSDVGRQTCEVLEFEDVVMEFGLFTIGERAPEPRQGAVQSEQDRLHRLARVAEHAEQIGLDVFAMGEHHNPPFVSSSQAATLGYIAGRTSRLTLSTATTLITTNDPVRLAEEFATLQLLSDDRVDLMLGKGNTPAVYEWFSRGGANSTDLADENYALLRRLWDERQLDWEGRFRTPLHQFTSIPRPLVSGAPFVWHGAVSGTESAGRAARYGDGFFANNLFAPVSHFARMIDDFRERWESHGRSPEDARIGAGGILFVRPDSQRARAEFAPHHDANPVLSRGGTLEDVARATGLIVGSPAEVVDRILAMGSEFGPYHRQLFNVDLASLPERTVHEVIDLVGGEVLPALRRETRAEPPLAAAADKIHKKD